MPGVVAVAVVSPTVRYCVMKLSTPAMRAAVEAMLIPVEDPETGAMGPSPFVMPPAIQALMKMLIATGGAGDAPWVQVVGPLINAMVDKIKADIAKGVPSFAHGGIVPGPVGMPRLVVAHGGEPIGSPGRVTNNRDMAINNNFYGDVYGMDDFRNRGLREIREAVLGGAFHGVLARA